MNDFKLPNFEKIMNEESWEIRSEIWPRKLWPRRRLHVKIGNIQSFEDRWNRIVKGIVK